MGRVHLVMKFQIKQLALQCTHEREIVNFVDFNYFHGPVGAGKTTIAKLIDFCLGADFEPTPILQPIFTQALLHIQVNDRDLMITRERDSGSVRAQWNEDANNPIDLVLPARKASGIVVPGTEIEVLSDLIFHLAGVKPPRVRKSKVREDSELVRLSFRDLFWYCYLDQDSMDSSFFKLDDDANPFERLKSLDVLRFIIGFHQEKISELESDLVNIRNERLRCEGAAIAIKDAFESEQIATKEDIFREIEKASNEVKIVRVELEKVRKEKSKTRTHAVGELQNQGRELAKEISETVGAIEELERSIIRDREHKNTVLHLMLRQRRALTARSELAGIAFQHCPNCFQSLPQRPAESCPLCGQLSQAEENAPLESISIDADAKARAMELDERISLQRKNLAQLRRQCSELENDKAELDYTLNQALKNYDSAYLSTSLELEKRHARLSQKIVGLKQLQVLAERIDSLQEKVSELEGKEAKIRSDLKRERALAEKDRANLDLLENLFLDCLLQSKLPGISSTDKMEILSPHFLPEVIGHDSGNLVTTTFSNMSSGGKKNLFKCCFALAIHRLSKRSGALLPTILIVDSPMKNISERENRDQWIGFNELLYYLAKEELQNTQFIIFDKEYYPPSEGHSFSMNARYMRPDDPQNPPLLRSHVEQR